MNSIDQLPSKNQGQLKTFNEATNRKAFGSLSSMTKSVIFSKNSGQKIQFSNKLGGLKTGNNLTEKLSFKKDNIKSSEDSFSSYGNMHKSMMLSDYSTNNTFDFNKSNSSGLERSYTKNQPSLSKTQTIDEFINRHKSSNYSFTDTPLTNSYLKFSQPSGTFNDLNSNQKYKNIGVSLGQSKYSFQKNQKYGINHDNFTGDNYKSKDSLYDYSDKYNNKYTQEYSPISSTSNKNYLYNYAYQTEHKDSYQTFNKHQIPINAFSKNKNYDYNSTNIYQNTINNYSKTNNLNINSSNSFMSTNLNNFCDTSLNNTKNKSNSENKLESNIKQSDFKKGKKLGKGKFGQVFLVQHKKTGFICALKIISKQIIKQEKVQDQLVREIKIQLYLKNNNLVSLYGFFQDYQNVYLLMELCTDGQVFNLLKQRRRVQQLQVRSIIRDVCIGLQYVHSQRIIHRDIKPENVIMQYGVAKLCDFGWAVFRGSGLRNTYCGTPLYTSPQLIRGEDYDEKIDIWAVGVLTYELLTGRIPFQIHSEDDMNRILQDQITFPTFVQISHDAKDFIFKTLDRSRGGTYLSADNLLGHPFLRISKKQNIFHDIEKII